MIKSVPQLSGLLVVAPSQYQSARPVEHVVMGREMNNSPGLWLWWYTHLCPPRKQKQMVCEFKISMAYSARSRPTKVT